MKIVVSGSSSGLGKAIAEHLKACGHEVFGLSRREGHDVRREFALIDYADMLDGVDGLVCCAAVMDGTLVDVISTNLLGTWNAIEAFPAKRIICFAGGGAPEPLKGFSAYNVSKTAVIALIANYALENPNCSINAISPGAHQTGMSKVGETNPARLLKMVDWLLTQDAITGRCLSLKHDDWENEEWRKTTANYLELYTLKRQTSPQ